ncbi:flagellar export protein FliJ [Natranaerobius thermophilus]|uniref:Flagellar FliJ protein n=1 Tax=Natranaerobius thermophilus (strain ATCC BAA-1301 / DSM 18059 / JW/NM-WN-LF) TaxID=457570 RepID=B2A347_NATTJ|nr:flagellar export protein FliJ [Natranaerobius thermophilus]ACB84978.1 flagellar export protein FliJ [Natranaerobius thermophilus JW/NM-WN-LF]
MKKFQFSLEKVLKVKERNEELKKKEFQRAQKYRDEQKQALDKLLDKRHELCEDILTKQKSPVKIENITHYYSYLSHLDDEIINKRHQLEDAEEQLEQARLNWIEAKREKKVLEKLEERQYEEYKQKVLKNEQKTLDELSVQFSYSR